MRHEDLRVNDVVKWTSSGSGVTYVGRVVDQTMEEAITEIKILEIVHIPKNIPSGYRVLEVGELWGCYDTYIQDYEFIGQSPLTTKLSKMMNSIYEKVINKEI